MLLYIKLQFLFGLIGSFVFFSCYSIARSFFSDFHKQKFRLRTREIHDFLNEFLPYENSFHLLLCWSVLILFLGGFALTRSIKREIQKVFSRDVLLVVTKTVLIIFRGNKHYIDTVSCWSSFVVDWLPTKTQQKKQQQH